MVELFIPIDRGKFVNSRYTAMSEEDTDYRSRNFKAASAYTSGSNSFGFLISSLLLAGCFLNGVALMTSILVNSGAPTTVCACPPSVSAVAAVVGGATVIAEGGATTVKRPSSEGSASRMRSPSDVWSTALVNRLPVAEGCGDVDVASEWIEREILLRRSILSESVSEGPIGVT